MLAITIFLFVQLRISEKQLSTAVQTLERQYHHASSPLKPPAELCVVGTLLDEPEPVRRERKSLQNGAAGRTRTDNGENPSGF
jgi:hypothetical protein